MSPRESEIPAVYQSEGRRLRPSLATEAVLKLRAEAAREQSMALKDRPEEDPERVKAEQDFEESNLDLEIFDLTHDPTGALKREAIGTDLAEQLSSQIEAEQEPAASVASPELVTPVFMVNMGELDRLNKVSPDFGNEALTRLADAISKKLESAVGPVANGDPSSFYKLYRADNNSFMVRFTEKIPNDLASSIREQLAARAGEAWGNGDDPFEAKGVEAPPVIADMVSVEEVMAGLPPSLRESGKAETYAVGALKDVLYTMQDAQKIVSRVDRMRDAIATDEAKARDLYDKFLKKSISGVFVVETGPNAVETPVETFEQFKAYLASQDQDPTHAKAELWETAYGKVLGDLRVRYEKNSKYAKKIQNFVAEKVKEERGLAIEERRSSIPPGAELPADKPNGDFKEPNYERATEGLRAFAQLRTELAFIKDNLEKAKTQNASAEELEHFEQAKRIAEKKFAREKVKRDQATGLELRGPLFRRMESALTETPEHPEGKRVAAVSIDMGFLKYFDVVGGRETGDLAILKAAEVFQSVRDEFSKEGVEVSVHRLGGDEFGMTVVGESSVTPERFQKTLRELRRSLLTRVEQAGRIPARTGSKPGYYATNINIGVGIHAYENLEAAKQEDQKYALTESLAENGTATHEAQIRNRRAEHLLSVADKLMEFQKASSRFKTLLEKMKGIESLKANDGSDEDVRREEEHLKQLLAFSDKAIFGQSGREILGVVPRTESEEDSETRMKTWRERLVSGESPEDLDEAVHEFVWSMMEKNFTKEQGEQRELESHIEYAVRIEYLRGRIDDLQAKLNEAEGIGGKLKERYEHEQTRLRDRLKAAEEDLSAVRAVRTAMGG